jgi:hypothetical protein
MTDLPPNDQKELIKQAIKEWMDEKYAEIGRWTVRVIITTALSMLLFWYIKTQGFKFP